MNALPPPGQPLAVVSPHLDDAVLGCGRLIAAHPGSVVVTLFAGRPPRDLPLTEWDAAAGFAAGDDVIGLRREEDRRALAIFGARPLWLDFLDAQYGATPSVETLSAALDRALAAIALPVALMPLGLFHSDHALAHAACLALLQRGGRSWFAYEEPMYRLVPGLLDQRLEALRHDGLVVTRAGCCAGHPDEPKRRAVAAYASQLRALATPGRPGHLDAFAPEVYWSLRA